MESWQWRSSFQVQQCRTPSTAAAFRLQWCDRIAMTFPSPSSTMSNSIDVHNDVSVHRCRISQWRFPFPSSTMSNSIDSRIPFPSASSFPVNNVELIDQLYAKSSLLEFHQHSSKAGCLSTMWNSIDVSQWCLRSTMSNSINYPTLTHPVFSLEIAVELSVTAN